MIFQGLKVIDCGSFIAAPAAAMVLSDFGADVVKIEPPGGDTFRNLSKMPGHPRSEPARIQLFEHVLAPLADLPVREIVSATHILTDLTLSPATVIYDYLADLPPA